MGVFSYLSVSKSVNQTEWEPVYREALALAQMIELAKYREQEISGVLFDGKTRGYAHDIRLQEVHCLIMGCLADQA